ncbi:MAG: hypothetical protein DRP45_11065 [Candidatus Zixiibacteriota bacterium]|nr:MAG: hypothetical protein DRP45_11065 [candidate division Zixibacteria bacterium]
MLSNSNNWLKVKLTGYRGTVNAGAVGAQVRITVAGLGTQVRQVENATGWGNQNDPTLHFGLGVTAGPVSLNIDWPDGTSQVVSGVAVDQTVAIAYGNVPTSSDTVDDLVVYGDGVTVTEATWSATHIVDPCWFDDPCGVLDDTEMTTTTSAAWGITSDDALMGDVNGDGVDDIVAVRISGAHFGWYGGHSTVDGNGQGSIGSQSYPAADSYVLLGEVAGSHGNFLADIDGDGTDDAICVYPGFLWGVQTSTAAAGLGGGGWQGFSQFGLEPPTADQPFVGDFDGDGREDIGVYRIPGGNTLINFTYPDPCTVWGGTLGPIGQCGGFAGQDTLLVANLNDDGYDDAVMVRQDGDGLIWWIGMINDGTGLISYFEQPVGDPAVPTAGLSFANFGLDNGGDTPFMADINGDGMDDICISRRTADGRKQWYAGFTTAGGTLYADAVGDDNGDFGQASDTAMFADLDSEISDSNVCDDLVVFAGAGDGLWSGSRTRIGPFYMNGNLDTEMYLPLSSAAPADPNYDNSPMLGDVDGDGVDDVVTRDGDTGAWTANLSEVDGIGIGSLSSTYQTSNSVFGTTDVSAQFIADINGDGAEDAISVNSVSFIWSVVNSTSAVGLGSSVSGTVQWGLGLPTVDQPFVGDFNGDGKTDIGVYRGGSGVYIKFTDPCGVIGGGTQAPLGQIGTGLPDEQVLYAAELDGDPNMDAVMVWQSGAGLITWYGLINKDGTGDFNYSNPGTTFVGFGLDNGDDIPFIADLNGDGLDDIAVYRVSTGVWYTTWTTAGGALGTNGNGDDVQFFGAPGNIPLVGQLGATCPAYDLDDDCDVDIVDLDEFVQIWLEPYSLAHYAGLASEWLIDCPADPECN